MIEGAARLAHRGCEDFGASAWKVLAASVVGRGHAARGKGNEDAVATAALPDGTVLLALADGAGSAALAGEGARLAVSVAIDSLMTADFGAAGCEAVLRSSLAAVRRATAARAREQRIRPREFACTLLLALVRDDTLAVLQLGDGAVVARDEAGWRRLTEPQRGRHAGETVFVTGRGAGRLAQVELCPATGMRALALLSDGLEPVATDVASGRPHDPFFEPLVAFASAERAAVEQEAELVRFLAGDRIQARSGDDLSLVLAVSR